MKCTGWRVDDDEKGKVQHGCLRIMRLYCLIVHAAATVLRATLPTRAPVRDCCSQRPFPHESALQSMRKSPDCVRLFFVLDYTAVAVERGDV
jgi:hypothetical protein